MRGFNPGAVIPKRDLREVVPMRFNLIVKIHPEKEASEFIVMPDSAKAHRDTTRGWFGTVTAVGGSIAKMKKMVGKITPGTVCMFDESVSIDDPNRCFDWGDDRYVMFDVETVMGIMRVPARGSVKNRIEMLGDRVLLRKPRHEDFKMTKSKLWIPAGHEKQEVGGVVVETGPGLYNPQREKYQPVEFKKGDFVLFSKYAGTDIAIEGVEHVVVRQDKILAIVEGETDRLKFA